MSLVDSQFGMDSDYYEIIEELDTHCHESEWRYNNRIITDTELKFRHYQKFAPIHYQGFEYGTHIHKRATLGSW